MKRIFYFVRHGETRFNLEKRMQGRCDSPLTQKGIQQLEALKEKLDQQYFDQVFASSAGRVRESSSILLRDKHYPIQFLDDLQEPFYGTAEGEKFEGHQEMYDCFDVFDWTSLQGESHSQVEERIQRVFDYILTQTKEDDRILIVAHGTMMELIEQLLLKVDILEYRKECLKQGKASIPNAGTLIFSYENGQYRLEREPRAPEDLELLPIQKNIHFYFVRHGQTLFNEQKKVMGRSDAPLSEKGKAQALLVKEALQGIPFSNAYSSFAKRAIDTTKLILNSTAIPMSIEKDLQQLDFGDLEGCYRDEAIEEEMNRCHRQQEDFRTHGGEWREDLVLRFQHLLSRIVQQAKDGDYVLLVSHGTYYTILLEEYTGTSRKELQHQQEKLGKKESYHGGIACFDWKLDHIEWVQRMVPALEFKEES